MFLIRASFDTYGLRAVGGSPGFLLGALGGSLGFSSVALGCSSVSLRDLLVSFLELLGFSCCSCGCPRFSLWELLAYM